MDRNYRSVTPESSSPPTGKEESTVAGSGGCIAAHGGGHGTVVSDPRERERERDDSAPRGHGQDSFVTLHDGAAVRKDRCNNAWPEEQKEMNERVMGKKVRKGLERNARDLNIQIDDDRGGHKMGVMDMIFFRLTSPMNGYAEYHVSEVFPCRGNILLRKNKGWLGSSLLIQTTDGTFLELTIGRVAVI